MNDTSNVTARIAYDDLREWLARAELLGEVRHVKGASWQEDIGLVAGVGVVAFERRQYLWRQRELKGGPTSRSDVVRELFLTDPRRIQIGTGHVDLQLKRAPPIRWRGRRRIHVDG